jgi:hypothetical protein
MVSAGSVLVSERPDQGLAKGTPSDSTNDRRGLSGRVVISMIAFPAVRANGISVGQISQTSSRQSE